MKKIGLALLTAVLALTVTFTSVSAAPAGWSVVGTDTYTMNGNINDVRYDKVISNVNSGGYKVFIPGHYGTRVTCDVNCGPVLTMLVTIWEYDPENPDDKVSEHLVHPDGNSYVLTVPDVGPWVDGGNGAEFYTTHQTQYTVNGGGGYLRGIEYWD